MIHEIECPYCDGHAILQNEERKLSFRKESFSVRVHYYRCQKCKEEFTTTEVDTVTMLQLYNQYRENNGIPFPEEITKLRERYGLTATKMSAIFGLGINSYSNYEKGEVPSLSNANLISMAQKPRTFLALLEKAESKFSDSAYKKVYSKVQQAIEEFESFNAFDCAINNYNKPSKYTGYKTPDFDKIAGLVSILLQNCNEEYNDKLKLNKLLFYTDFINYKNHGSSITGITYRAIKLGPVPTNYDNIYALLKDNYITSEFRESDSGGAREIFFATAEINLGLFTEKEIESINIIISKFKESSTWDVVNLSHREGAWKKLNADSKVISYQDFAFDINEL